MRKLVLLAGAVVLSGGASAGSIRASYDYDFSSSVSFNTTALNFSNLTTARIKGSRVIDPNGGTDNILPRTTSNSNPFRFNSYCAEIGEHITKATYTHANVSYLLGSSTNTGAPFGSAFFNATRTANLQKLWGNYSVTSAIEAAAFQLAQWEIVFDTDVSLVQGANGTYGNAGFLYKNSFAYNSLGTDVYNRAETMLRSIRLGTVTRQAQLVLLSGGGVQDQVVSINGSGPGNGTNAVPEPFTMGLGIAAASVFVRRRVKARTS